MDQELEKAIDLNLTARVLLVCSAHNIKLPEEINRRKEKVKQAVMRRVVENGIGAEGLSELLDECIARLEFELEHPNDNSDSPTKGPVDSIHGATREEAVADRQSADIKMQWNNDSAYRLRAVGMTQKLESERKPIQTLLLEDCVQLGLLKRKRAEYLVTQFSGKLPNEAEEEVVVELRNNLHQQIRRFMRKHKGGPWASPKEQEDLRLEIARTPTVRSLLFLTRQILRERREWLDKNSNSITGWLFGKRL